MSNLIIANTPDVEEIFVNELQKYFYEDIKFSDLFPKSDSLKISATHPFVALFEQVVPEGSTYDLSGFPCLTITDMNSNRALDVPIQGVNQVARVTRAILEDIKSQGRNKYIMSKQTLTDLETAFEGKDYLLAEFFQTFKKSHVAIEIWSDNKIIKDKLFDLVNLFLINDKRLMLNDVYGLKIDDNTMNGEKSGTFNFDFGKTLYGGMIYLEVDYSTTYTTVKDFTVMDGAVVTDNEMI